MSRRWWCAARLVLVGCGPSDATYDGVSLDEDGVSQTLGVLRVNECRGGSGGYVELVNTSSAAVDPLATSGTCWFVDDVEGGAAPLQVTDFNVRHDASRTLCQAAGRRAT